MDLGLSYNMEAGKYRNPVSLVGKQVIDIVDEAGAHPVEGGASTQ